MNEFYFFDWLCLILTVGVVWKMIAQGRLTAVFLMNEAERKWKYVLFSELYFYKRRSAFLYHSVVSYSSVFILFAALLVLAVVWPTLTVLGYILLPIVVILLPSVVILVARLFMLLIFVAGTMPWRIHAFFIRRKYKKEAVC